MSKIHVLYVGDDDWTTKYSIPDNIEFEVYESDESEPTANRPARKLMDLVILDRDITLSEEKKFTKFTRGYCLFATENVKMLNSATSRYFKARMGQYLYTGDVQYFLAHEVRNYYPNPYGEKFNPAKLAISDSLQVGYHVKETITCFWRESLERIFRRLHTGDTISRFLRDSVLICILNMRKPGM